jgi:hypothetical protein
MGIQNKNKEECHVKKAYFSEGTLSELREIADGPYPVSKRQTQHQDPY